MRSLWMWLYRLVFQFRQWLMRKHPWSRRRFSVALTAVGASPPRRIFAQPKPKWVKHDIIRLKAVMPQAGCRTIAHHFNRRGKKRCQGASARSRRNVANERVVQGKT